MSNLKFSRKTILRACDVLGKQLGHSQFDHFILELGLPGINAGRARGSLVGRATALAEYVLADPDRAAEGEPIARAVIRGAADAGAYYATASDAEGVHGEFWRSLRADGWDFVNNRIVPGNGESEPPELPPATPKPLAPRPQHTVLPAIRPVEPALAKPPGRTKVFIVHGRDAGSKHDVARFLEKLDLEAIILHERANGGRTLISKFQEESADIRFAVVLMTPDDVGGLVGGEQKPRARQNVIFELGFFIGKLGAKHVCALVADDIDKPSDFDAVVYIKYGEGTAWRTDLARELQHAGIHFDPQRLL